MLLMRKYDEENSACLLSHPVRGAWIEISGAAAAAREARQSHPVRGAWIEISCQPSVAINQIESHPVRGAWIEITDLSHSLILIDVAPRQGCVD